MNDMTFNEHATAFEAELNASNQSFAADFREASALKGDPGENGGYYEPTVTQIDEDTVEVSFTASKNGMAFVESKTITLPAGKDGQDGRDGTNGKDGEPGAKGDPGEPGADGKTPVKGTDYFTAADKQEMVTAVLAALPRYNGEVTTV